MRLRFDVHLTHIVAIKGEFTLLRRVLAADQTQHRGLATARHAHQCRDFAARNAKRDVVQDDAVPVAEAEVFEFNQQWRCGQGHVSKNKSRGRRLLKDKAFR